MSAAAKPNAKGKPIMAWHGPQGAIAVGRTDWNRLTSLLTGIAAPSFIALYWAGGHYGTIYIALCAPIFAVRLTRLRGSANLLQEVTMFWGLVFGGASLALFLLHLWMGATSLSGVPTLAAAAYGWAFVVHYNPQRLGAFQPGWMVTPQTAEASLDTLKGMREELVHAQDAFASFDVFDKDDAEFVAAWERRSVGEIAEMLAIGDALTQDSWQRATAILNKAISYRDAGRAALAKALPRAEAAVKPFNIDYAAIAVPPSELAYGYTSFAIPKQLDFKRIDRQLFAFMDPDSRVAAYFTQGSEPLRIAWKVWAAVNANPIRYLYKSKWLRQFKDIEGELAAKAEAVKGDCRLIATDLATKAIPELGRIIDAITTIDEGLGPLATAPADSPQAKDWALKLAFAYLQGKRILETKAGN